MSKNTNQPPSITRSSAAEYLTFVAASGNQETSVEMRYEDENIWLTQKMMAEIYGVETHTINYHLKNIFADKELAENSVIKDYLITAADGKNYNVQHLDLPLVLAVGYRVRSTRGTQFRRWATSTLEECITKGFVNDDAPT